MLAINQARAGRSRANRGGSASRKKFGRLCSEQSSPASLTKDCRFPKINDLTSDRVIAYAGELIAVNCTRCILPEQFLVESAFECFEGGEMAALVRDWHEDSKEVWARPQVSSDGPTECSGAIHIFGLDNVCTIDNHVLRLLQPMLLLDSFLPPPRGFFLLSHHGWQLVARIRIKAHMNGMRQMIPR